jgi:hypothetical protein
MTAAFPASRPVRRYEVVRGAALALAVEGRPGRLYSVARLPEGAVAPAHPWLDGVSHDPRFEHALRQELLVSADFDDFLERLIRADFDVAADDGMQVGFATLRLRKAPLRLHADGKASAVAALWPGPGQLSTLAWQPSPGAFVYPHALVTVYRPEALTQCWRALEATSTFQALLSALATCGYVPKSEGPA